MWIWKDKMGSKKYPRKNYKMGFLPPNRGRPPSGFTQGTLTAMTQIHQDVRDRLVRTHQGAAAMLAFVCDGGGNVVFSPSGSESASPLCSVGVLVKVYGYELSPIESSRSKTESWGTVAYSVKGLSAPKPVKHGIQIQWCFHFGDKIANFKTPWKQRFKI